MKVKFVVVNTKYYDGTQAGYEKAMKTATEITVTGCKSIEDALGRYRGKYPESQYDFDDVRWED